jgi:hypothetical protein
MRDLTGLVLWTLCGLIGVPAAKRKMATKTDGKPPFALACRAASIISPANTFTVPSPSRDRPHVSGCQSYVVSLVEEQRPGIISQPEIRIPHCTARRGQYFGEAAHLDF